MSNSSTTKNILFTVLSVALGIYAQMHKMHITAPIFNPILAACTAPHDSIDDFAKATGYQPYDAATGLGIFTPIVCVVTQFMYQLRNTYPEGFLTWGLAVVGAIPFAVIGSIEAGRSGARGPIRYPTLMGIVHQLLGMSASIPLFWVPAYIWGRGNGPASVKRVYSSVPMQMIATIFWVVVFTADTDGYMWRLAAGILALAESGLGIGDVHMV